MSPMVKQPLAMEHALLGVLRRAPMHGYQLHQRLAAAHELGLVWRLKEPQLYRLLGRLEEAGYIVADAEVQTARPARKTWRVTEAGEAAFAAWVRAPVSRGRDLRLEFLAKLYFAQQVGPDAVRGLVSEQRRVLEVWLARLERDAERARASSVYDWLVLDFRRGQLRAVLAWLATCEEAAAWDTT